MWNPSKDVPSGPHYKNPKVFENGAFLDDAVTNGKYGDDIFTDRVLTFIKQNSSNKFFVYFPITLCHDPFSPTPDDPEFGSWKRGNDTTFFPSMIKYMDKKIGQVIDSLKKWQLYNNTIVLFAGDNGTPRGIFYNVNGVRKEGQKGSSKSSGTHVPLLVTWPNGIAPGQVNNSLVDFTDILPTFADAAALTIPAGYGNVDGKSFYNQLRGLPYAPRDWVFCHYQPNTNKGNDKLKRWIQNTQYKLYDSTGRFYNIILDPDEANALKVVDMTPAEKQIKRNLQAVMNTLK